MKLRPDDLKLNMNCYCNVAIGKSTLSLDLLKKVHYLKRGNAMTSCVYYSFKETEENKQRVDLERVTSPGL